MCRLKLQITIVLLWLFERSFSEQCPLHATGLAQRLTGKAYLPELLCRGCSNDPVIYLTVLDRSMSVGIAKENALARLAGWPRPPGGLAILIARRAILEL